MRTEHTCSYHCDRPECIKAQRDEMRERLKRLDSQPVPVEPVKVYESQVGATAYQLSADRLTVTDNAICSGEDSVIHFVLVEDYDTLQSELQQVTEERDRIAKESILAMTESKGRELAHKKRAEAAESISKRMVELLREPVAYRYKYHAQTSADSYVWVFDQDTWNGQKPIEVQPVYVMSAELLKEVGE